MAINEAQRNKILMFGAVAGVITKFILGWIALPVLNFLAGFVPGISAKLAGESTAGTISISVRESLTGINGALSGWLVDVLGLSLQSNWIMNLLMTVAGGAVFMIAGAYGADALGLLKGNARQKTAWMIFAGSALAAFIIGGFTVPEIGVGLVDTLIAFGINAAILAWLYVAIDEQFNIGLIPF